MERDRLLQPSQTEYRKATKPLLPNLQVDDVEIRNPDETGQNFDAFDMDRENRSKTFMNKSNKKGNKM